MPGVRCLQYPGMNNISRIPDAEVSLRLAFWLLERGHADGSVDVALDGAQVRVGDTVHFNLPGF